MILSSAPPAGQTFCGGPLQPVGGALYSLPLTSSLWLCLFHKLEMNLLDFQLKGASDASALIID